MPNGHIQLHQTRPSIIVTAMIDQAPDEVPVDRVGRERRGDGHQRRRLEEERDRPTLQVAKVGDEQEEQEEPEEEGFVGASDLDHVIEILRRVVLAWDCLGDRGRVRVLPPIGQAQELGQGQHEPGEEVGFVGLRFEDDLMNGAEHALFGRSS